MDTVYIKMCDCPEIQKIAWDDSLIFGDGAVVAFDAERAPIGSGIIVKTTATVCDCWAYELHAEDIRYIWLPRQDDLQKMMKEPTTSELLDKFYSWFYRTLQYAWDTQSMEQLWLAFYMKEKFSKRWSTKNEEWIKIQ